MRCSGVGLGKACLRTLNNVGESNAPCGTPLCNVLIPEISRNLPAEKYIGIFFLRLLCKSVFRIFSGGILLRVCVRGRLCLPVTVSMYQAGGTKTHTDTDHQTSLI